MNDMRRTSINKNSGRCGSGFWALGSGQLPRTPNPEPRTPNVSLGFTLVETLMVTTLFLIIAGGLLTMLLSGQTSYLSADAALQVQEEARRAYDVMIRELREAGASNLATWQPTTPDVPPGSGFKQLNFQIARGYNGVGCTNTICWGSENANGEWIHYAVVDNPTLPDANDLQLVRCVDANATTAITDGTNCRVLANDIQSVTFAYAGGAVTVNLQAQYQDPRLPGNGQASTQLLSSRVKLRNI